MTAFPCPACGCESKDDQIAVLREALEDYYGAVAFQLGRVNPKEPTPMLTKAAAKARAALAGEKANR